MSSFEERLNRLEEISRKINDPTSVEEALTLFEEGIELSRELEDALEKIERRVEILQNPPTNQGDPSSSLSLFPDLEDGG